MSKSENAILFWKMTDFAFCIFLAIKMIKVCPAGLAGMVNVFVAIWCNKAVAFKLRALTYYASAATRYHLMVYLLWLDTIIITYSMLWIVN